MKLYELDHNNPIDRELEKTANDAATDGSLDPNDIDGQNEPEMDDPLAGGMEDPAMANPAQQEPPASPAKPVNSALLSMIQGHDYIQNYDHSDPNKPYHPTNILGMEMEELSDLRNRIRGETDRASFMDQKTVAANQERVARTQMLSFVDSIMMYKKRQAKDTDSKGGNKPNVKEQTPSKVVSGKQFKPKKN